MRRRVPVLADSHSHRKGCDSMGIPREKSGRTQHNRMAAEVNSVKFESEFYDTASTTFPGAVSLERINGNRIRTGRGSCGQCTAQMESLLPALKSECDRSDRTIFPSCAQTTKEKIRENTTKT